MNKPLPAGLQAGFTLTEVLVVVAIVAMLAGLLFPTFQHAQEKASAVQCSGNMRQIGVALASYAADHNATMPPVSSLASYPPYPSMQQEWEYAIWPYAGYEMTDFKSPQNDFRCKKGAVVHNIFRCPKIWKNPTPVPKTSQGVNVNKYSYGLNARLAAPDKVEGGASYVTPIRLAMIKSPARAMLLNENTSSLGTHDSYLHWSGLIPHDGGGNFLFVDGHVEWKLLKDLPSDSSSAGRSFWNGL